MAWPERVLTIVVPADRRVRAQPTVRILHSRRIEDWRHEASSIPRMRLEAAVILRVDWAVSRAAAIDVLVGATSGRRTTASRLRYELGAWPRLHHRALLAEVLEDVEDGVASPLERHWRRDVERPHGLPSAGRNVRLIHEGRSLYRDLDYDPYRLVAELDGRLYHPDAERFRDRARDNLAAREQRFALRYGWREVVSDPCGCAREVADVLKACGWPGDLHPCDAHCTAVARAAAGM
jgi:hypothetical protein